ncbi:jg14513 [Pararge aegeria aegeria]|uniref:Jg14513 protein n=1 Tax=Pararge aegeria aegeria TaxID=348720 RepID=A0A8S4S4M7_9NEOP|nr:jg14513 [Pararge aegeria aegeria]
MQGYIVTKGKFAFTANHRIKTTHHTRSLVAGLANVRGESHFMIERYCQVCDLVLPRYRTPVEGDLCGVYREAASRFAREEHSCALLGVHFDPPKAAPLAEVH